MDDPLIGGPQKSFISQERVPDWMLPVAHLAALGAIRFSPDAPRSDRIRHAHGYLMAISLNQFGTSFVKGIVGRRRPNEEAARALGRRTRSKSFYSGHASNTFCLATYATLYAWRRTDRSIVRAAVPLALYGAATYTAWSRVAEHRHYPSDVIVGGVAGSGVAVLLFRWYDRMPVPAAERIAVGPVPGGLAIAVRF